MAEQFRKINLHDYVKKYVNLFGVRETLFSYLMSICSYINLPDDTRLHTHTHIVSSDVVFT